MKLLYKILKNIQKKYKPSLYVYNMLFLLMAGIFLENINYLCFPYKDLYIQPTTMNNELKIIFRFTKLLKRIDRKGIL